MCLLPDEIDDEMFVPVSFDLGFDLWLILIDCTVEFELWEMT